MVSQPVPFSVSVSVPARRPAGETPAPQTLQEGLWGSRPGCRVGIGENSESAPRPRSARCYTLPRHSRASEGEMARSSVVRVLGILLLLAFLTPAATAQENEESQETRYLGDRFSIRVVGVLVDMTAEVVPGRGLAALLDREEVLGFDDQIFTFGLEGFYRFTKNRKHAIRFRYGNFDRDAYAVLEGTVPILDLEFTADVASKFVNQVAIVEYQYSFTNNGKTEAGILAGLAVYKYDLALAGEVVIDDDPDQTEFRSKNVDVIAPVPGFGFFINQALRKDLILEIKTSFIDLDIGEHNGRIFSTWVSLTWFFSHHVGVGVGLSGSDVAYKKEGSEKIKVEIRQSAINANLTFVF